MGTDEHKSPGMGLVPGWVFDRHCHLEYQTYRICPFAQTDEENQIPPDYAYMQVHQKKCRFCTTDLATKKEAMRRWERTPLGR